MGSWIEIKKELEKREKELVTRSGAFFVAPPSSLSRFLSAVLLTTCISEEERKHYNINSTARKSSWPNGKLIAVLDRLLIGLTFHHLFTFASDLLLCVLDNCPCLW